MFSEHEREDSGEKAKDEGARVLPWILAAVILLALAGIGYIGYRIFDRLELMETRLAELNEQASEATRSSEQAMEQASRAEENAKAAAEGRALAEAETGRAKEAQASAVEQAEAAKQNAATAQQQADAARAEAERVRKEAEAELARLEEALSKIAETHRTALGLVMNLGEDSLKFDFDKAEVKPENRELLSRIAGILLTSSDYTISVNGHTDDVGTDEYNQKLSERRAQAVREYLVDAGVSPDIISVTGWGKSKPLVQGTTPEARAKNRRVELGIVNSRVKYRTSQK
jgi:outer membrane protein OmpA-like peptidoglycan-associated protein